MMEDVRRTVVSETLHAKSHVGAAVQGEHAVEPFGVVHKAAVVAAVFVGKEQITIEFSVLGAPQDGLFERLDRFGVTVLAQSHPGTVHQSPIAITVVQRQSPQFVDLIANRRGGRARDTATALLRGREACLVKIRRLGELAEIVVPGGEAEGGVSVVQ